MEDEKTTAELEAEKKATKSEANKDGDGVDTDGGEGVDGTGADIEKKDYSKMSDEEIIVDLKTKHEGASSDELLAELAKQTKIIGHKNRAIDSLKKDTKKPEEKIVEKKQEENDGDELDKPITKRDLVKLNNKNAVEALTNTETTDPDARAAIIAAYENDIKQTGDIAKDFKKALAIASTDAFDEYRKNRSIAENQENQMVNFSGGGNYGADEGNVATSDAKKRAVGQNLKSAGFDKKAIDEELAKL